MMVFDGQLGKRGSTWRFWGNKKGDFYLSVRTLGGILKTSFHRDRRCHTGFTSTYANENKLEGSWHIDRWEIPDEPFVKALQVVTPVGELEEYKSAEATPMKWLPIPPTGFVSVVTIALIRPDYVPAVDEPWPGAAYGTQPIGVAITKLRSAFLVCSQNPMDEAMKRDIEGYRERIIYSGLQKGLAQKPGLRAILIGQQAEGNRFLIEMAYRYSKENNSRDTHT